MNSRVIQNVAGTLSAREEYTMIMDRFCEIKAEMYG